MRIFDNIRGRFHLRFKDRQSAGDILGEGLKDFIKKQERKNCLVLGIPRGGIITGYAIAKKLNSRFDIIMPRKLCAPHNEELAIGAITGDGNAYINDLLLKELDIKSDYIEREKLRQLKEIERRTSLYHFNKTFPLLKCSKLRCKTVILADDGIATGATIISARRYIGSLINGCQIIIAAPVVPKSTLALLESEKIDHIEVLTTPADSEFKFVEQYYGDFHQITDQEVIKIIQNLQSKDLKRGHII